MNVNIKATNLELSSTLRQYIEEKINSLEKFAQTVKLEPLEVWVEVEKTTHHHHKGDVFRAEVQIRLSGKSIRSEATRDDLHIAINEVKDELQRELKQYTAKEVAKRKRGARRIKKDFHLSPKARFYRKGRIREEGI